MFKALQPLPESFLLTVLDVLRKTTDNTDNPFHQQNTYAKAHVHTILEPLVRNDYQHVYQRNLAVASVLSFDVCSLFCVIQPFALVHAMRFPSLYATELHTPHHKNLLVPRQYNKSQCIEKIHGIPQLLPESDAIFYQVYQQAFPECNHTHARVSGSFGLYIRKSTSL